MSVRGDSDRVRLEVAGLGTAAEARPPAARIAEGWAGVLTCQWVVRALAIGRGLALGGEAAVA